MYLTAAIVHSFFPPVGQLRPDLILQKLFALVEQDLSPGVVGEADAKVVEGPVLISHGENPGVR